MAKKGASAHIMISDIVVGQQGSQGENYTAKSELHQDITIGVIQSWSRGYIVSKEESCP